ncbi:hypothetical protein [Tsukamurella columbiensis]|uniref:DUF1295 domain-containing protein n=1 Tax=Tsukamurella columbiensis TaxID=128509 RepID=A0ABX1LI50_9ACTN|nr:hypothetical protein [Tsukamurella columbiensis]NMD56748.1 hypothetical protein [Tsukamurella columbiensis]
MVSDIAQWTAWSIAAVCLLVNFYTIAAEHDRRKNGAPSLAWVFWTSAGALAASTGVAVAIQRNAGAGVAAASLVVITALLVAIRSTRYVRLFGRVITMADR